VRRGAERRGVAVESSALSFGSAEARHVTTTGFTFELMIGRPWEARTVDAPQLQRRLRDATVVHVHQCLSEIGLFVASHARLLGKTVIGTDHGGGEHRSVGRTPEVGGIFDWFHAQSQFARRSFAGVDGEVRLVLGPVDTDRFAPRDPAGADPAAILTIGRIMGHKGFDRIVSALPAGLSLTIVGRAVDGTYLSRLQRVGRDKRLVVRTDVTDDGLLPLMRSAGAAVFASTHVDYRGRSHAKPELLGLAPLECLSTGVPTFVSDAGALPELAALPGCFLFETDAELRRLLERFRDGRLAVPNPVEMHEAVAERYGLVAFGLAYLENLKVVAP
jgi:glycosyltransferase involved in cell wall biosynthesis